MKDEEEQQRRSFLREIFLGWLERRHKRKLFQQWCDQEFLRLSLLELKTNLRIQRHHLKLLRLEEERLRRKPEYVS